jgi:starch synthase
MTDLARLAIRNSDGVIAGSPDLKESIMKEIEASDTKFLAYPGEDFKDAYLDFYDTL